MRGLFTSRQQPQDDPQEPAGGAATAAPDPVPTPSPSTALPGAPHTTHPQWEEGATAPRLYERIGGWSPGRFPPTP